MLGLFGNIGPPEILVVLVIAVLIFGKDLPQAASKAYLQMRKLRSAVDDLRRDSGIDRELRELERTAREAEWEARRAPPPVPALKQPAATVPHAAERMSAVTPAPQAPPEPEPTTSQPGSAPPSTEPERG